MRAIFWLLLAVVSNVSLAAEWVSIPSTVKSNAPRENSTYGKSLVLQLDKSSMIRDGDMVTVWFRMGWGRLSQQSNSTFDCKRRQSNTNDGFWLDENGARSKYQMDRNGFSPIVPDTASEVLFNYLCAKKPWEIWK